MALASKQIWTESRSTGATKSSQLSTVYLLLDSVLDLGELSLEHEVPESHFLQVSILDSLQLGMV